MNYAERSLLLWMCCVMRSTARRESQARESAAMFRLEQLPTANLRKVIVLLPSWARWVQNVYRPNVLPFEWLVRWPAPEEVLKLISGMCKKA